MVSKSTARTDYCLAPLSGIREYYFSIIHRFKKKINFKNFQLNDTLNKYLFKRIYKYILSKNKNFTKAGKINKNFLYKYYEAIYIIIYMQNINKTFLLKRIITMFYFSFLIL